jgi:hypothetical protein
MEVLGAEIITALTTTYLGFSALCIIDLWPDPWPTDAIAILKPCHPPQASLPTDGPALS